MGRKKPPDTHLSKEKEPLRADDAVESANSKNAESNEELKITYGVIANLNSEEDIGNIMLEPHFKMKFSESIGFDGIVLEYIPFEILPVVPEDKIQHDKEKQQLKNLLRGLSPAIPNESLDVVAGIPWVETTLASLTRPEGVMLAPPMTTETKFTPEERQALVFSQFTEFGRAHPDRAKPAAERIMEIAEELRPPSEERTLNTYQAAQRISQSHGIRLHETQLKRWFLNPNIQIGALGPNGKPVFSEVECDSFELPDRKPGRPAKKI
ncbi:hypothetical protein TA3x_005802 (plasmid) [Tundrisphaera sp. TA3]|uniref:hypothetical protein n=1 Tax=Tundrisphaera sp. TA3 TaxID=3435775 RepID=UPI003EBED9F6